MIPDNLTPQPLEYDNPFAAERRQVFSVTAFLGGCIFAIAWSIAFGAAVPRFDLIFRDFGTKLPAVTQIVLDIARWRGGWGWIAVWVVPIVLGFLAPFVAPARAGRRNQNQRWITALMLLLTGILVGLVVIALFLPMMALIQNVSPGKK